MSISRYCARCMSTFDGDPATCPNLGCGNRRPESGWGGLLGRGDLLDRRYRVEHPLAVGGAGITYLAREVDDSGKAQGPLVAVKVLYQARASGPFLRRLSTEAQILQELAHPNIVELRGFVHRAGHEPYLVTRFEEGGNLSQHVDRHGPLPARVAAGVLRQVLLALDTAHQRGVVHRDLKPDNVLLRTHTIRSALPEVRVADFGIAKVVGGNLHSNVTRAGAFVGTPEYAAPEQFPRPGPHAGDRRVRGGGAAVLPAHRAPPRSCSASARTSTSA
jgi:serine/threonine protein kinase